jgi:hypothetical protein
MTTILAHFVSLWISTSQLPDVRPDLVLPAVVGALTAETPDFPGALLISIAWGETRLDGSVHTGRVCGVMQSMITSPSDCRKWINPINGFRAGVAELEEWHHDHNTHGKLNTVLLAQACGMSAFNGTCTKQAWPNWVIDRARCLTPERTGTWHVDGVSGRCVRTTVRAS